MRKYSELFNYQSFDHFLKDWTIWNNEYDEIFKEFISSEEPTENLKTKVAILYEKIKKLNKYGLIVFRKEIYNNEISKKLRL